MGNRMSAGDWQTMLDGMAAAGGSSDVYYLKEKTTRLRLVLADGQDERDFAAETQSNFKGKVSTKFLMFAVVLGTSKDDDQNVSKTKVRAVRVPKSVVRSIIGNLVEGWDLFDPKAGHGLVITKVLTGDKTSYEVKVSPKPVAVAADLEWPESSLQDLADAEAKRQNERAKSGENAAAAEDSTDDVPF